MLACYHKRPYERLNHYYRFHFYIKRQHFCGVASKIGQNEKKHIANYSPLKNGRAKPDAVHLSATR